MSAYGAALTMLIEDDKLGGLKINALRLGSVTHGLDMDQRCATLRSTEQPGQQGDGIAGGLHAVRRRSPGG